MTRISVRAVRLRDRRWLLQWLVTTPEYQEKLAQQEEAAEVHLLLVWGRLTMDNIVLREAATPAVRDDLGVGMPGAPCMADRAVVAVAREVVASNAHHVDRALGVHLAVAGGRIALRDARALAQTLDAAKRRVLGGGGSELEAGERRARGAGGMLPV